MVKVSLIGLNNIDYNFINLIEFTSLSGFKNKLPKLSTIILNNSEKINNLYCDAQPFDYI